MSASPTTIVNVELFGSARTAAGVRELQVLLPTRAGASDLARALGAAIPELVGVVVDRDTARLLGSYTANINGETFMGDSRMPVARGDSILVFSSQAGG